MAEANGKRVLVVGGGISGLSVAWFLHRRGCTVTVAEAAGRVGGTIVSDQRDGFLFERGPNTALQKPGRPEDALGRLIDGAALSPQLNVAAPAGKKRYILRHGRLWALPASPPAFVVTPAFSLAAKLRLLAEPFIRRADQEETIAEFVKRRLGREFLNYAVDPFISGVYAGDPRELSAEAAVPRIHELEQEYGSLIRGAIALGKATKNAGMPAGRQISFAGGMATLPSALAAALPAGSVRTGRRATGLERRDGGWAVHFADQGHGPQTETADALVLALPAPETAALVEPLAGEAARLLRAIPYASVFSVALGYRREDVKHALDGFGFLIPRVEGVRTLGALFSSTLFADRAPPGHVLLTAFLGGRQDPQAMEMADKDVLTEIEVDLATTLGIRGKAALRHLTRWPQAIPQYPLGHLDRVATVDEFLAPFPDLYLRGNWRGGISVADCVRNGEALAERIASPGTPS
ncbi:MAG: protoporphyrinogen oxidase [Rhodospirillales bacterium]|nr:protoporphyrinogen oxidase [Rhodospirillales bacterium]